MFKSLLSFLLLMTGLFCFAAEPALAADKKALVVVSFGTTYEDTRKLDIEAVEGALQKAFPDRDFKRAFTSKIVMKRLAEEFNLKVDDLETVLKELKAKGYKDVLVQSTHLTPGEEYANKIMTVVAKYKNAFSKLAVGKPLMTEGEDFDLVAKALKQQIPAMGKDEIVVFMGHGSPNIHNTSYYALEKSFHKMAIPAIIGVVEEADHPNFDDMLSSLRASKAKSVLLMPLMLVCGDHAENDMASDEEDSWKTLLKEDGYKVDTKVVGIGRNAAIQDIYVLHAKNAQVIK